MINNSRIYKFKPFYFTVVILGCFFFAINSSASQPLKKLFTENCASCHTIGAGTLVGPDLKDVHLRRSQPWLLAFVKSPQSMISNNNSQAVALFKEYNEILMPDSVLTDQQIIQLLQYIQSATVNDRPANELIESVSNDQHQIKTGQDIFQGIVSLSNGGPACNGCHDIKNDAVIGGGILARELTLVFSRMGGPAIRSILGSAPFPVMKAAYLNKPLTDNEIQALLAFFQSAEREHAYQQPKDYGFGLFISGVVGSGLLLLIYSLIWSRRKNQSVYQAIYERQIKSK